jgi:hypothetical protein
MTVTTTDPFTAAVTDMVDAVIPAARIYVTNAVPAEPVMPYTVLAVTPDRPMTYRLSASHGVRVYRIILQSFARSYDGALDYDGDATSVLLDKVPVVTGYSCGPCVIEIGSAMTRDPDDNGVIGITTTLTFSATKETP